MKTSYVNTADIFRSGMRYDSSFYLSDGVSIRRTLSHSPYPVEPLSSVSERIFYGIRATRTYVSKKECAIPFLTGASIAQCDLSDTKLISKKYSPAIEEMSLHKGWVLITRSGTVGVTAWSNETFEGKYGSEDIIRLIPNKKVRGGIVYAFLASKYGQSLLTQGSFGAVIQHIEPSFVGDIMIPVFPEVMQRQVDDYMNESALLREKAFALKEEALHVLQKELRISFKKTNKKCASVSYRAILNSLQERLDPPAIMNDGVEAMNYVRTHVEYSLLKDLDVKVYRPGIFKRNYVADGIPYIKGSEIFKFNPFKSCEKLSRSRTPFVELMKLSTGQILITCAGSVGDIKMITKEYEDKGSIGSQDIIRLESQDHLFTKEYLFTYLQLPFVYDYIQSMKYGSVIERIEPFHVESIPVIKPSEDLSSRITTLIQAYMECTYKAFVCEEKAVHIVEQEIESWSK